MPVGTITQALLLIRPGTSVQASYTYHLTPSMPTGYGSAPPTQYYTTSGGSTHYTYASGHFVNMTSTTSSSFLSLITGRMANITNASFSPLGSFSADILISGLNVDMFELNGGVYYPVLGFAYPPNLTSTALDLDIVLTNLGRTTDFDATLAHEIMHSLGLRDVGPAGGGLYSGVENSGQYTMMAYNPHPEEGRAVIELQLYDVAAIQALHGRDISYNVTDTTINQFTETWGADAGKDRMFCIWDASGNDTIDASAMSDAAMIDLRPGYFSSIGPDSDASFTAGATPALVNKGMLNISIAYGAYIENAKGTGQGDLIIGNLLSNKLEGKDGDDIIYGEGQYALYDPNDSDDANYQQIITTGTHVEAAPAGVQAYLDNKGKQDDILQGGDGDDHLRGGRGDDLIEGGEDDDFIRGGGGFDEIWGGDKDDDEGTGDGTDIVDYSLVATGITITFTGDGGNSTLAVVDGEGGVDTLHSIERIVGTAQRDYFRYGGDIPSGYTLTIDAGAGQTGNDIINVAGGTSADGYTILNQVTGASRLTSNATGGYITLEHFHTQIIGSSYDDTITDEVDGNKTIDGGAGNDEITVTTGNCMLIGGDGDDVITGGDGNDLIIGDSQSYPSYLANVLNGGDGADHIISTSCYDEIDGGDGSDWIQINPGSLMETTVNGGGGNDVIDLTLADWTSVMLSADGGHDMLLRSNAGTPFDSYPNVVLDGIPYSDITIIWDISVSSTGYGGYGNGVGDAVVMVESTGATLFIPDVWGSVHFDFSGVSLYAENHMLIGFEEAMFYQYYQNDITIVVGDVSAYATAVDDYAAAAAGAPGANDGTSGDDTFAGSHGDDVIDGGDGNDSFDASGGTDSIEGGAGSDVLNLFGSRTSYSITSGGAGAMTVETLYGPEGLITLASVETVYFAIDNETYTMGDLIGYIGTSGADTLTGTYHDNEMSGLAGDDVLHGGGGYDTIYGGEGEDLLVGGADGDTLHGGDDDDILEGGTGFDTIDGGDGIDVARFAGASTEYAMGFEPGGGVRIGDHTEAGVGGGAWLTDIESLHFVGDNVTLGLIDLVPLGTSGNDGMTGTARSDIIWGLEGDDSLDGLGGDDEMYGGDDDDLYVMGLGNDIASDDNGDDGYLYNPGDGDDFIFDGWGTDYLAFGAGIAPEDVIVTTGPDDQYVLTFAGAAGSLFLANAAFEDYAIEEIRFDDETVWTPQDLHDLAFGQSALAWFDPEERGLLLAGSNLFAVNGQIDFGMQCQIA